MKAPKYIFIGFMLCLVVTGFLVWKFRDQLTPPAQQSVTYYPVTVKYEVSTTANLTKNDYKPTLTPAPGATPEPMSQDFVKTLTLPLDVTGVTKNGVKAEITGTQNLTVDKTGDLLTVTSKSNPDGVLNLTYPVSPWYFEAGAQGNLQQIKPDLELGYKFKQITGNIYLAIGIKYDNEFKWTLKLK